MPRPSVVPEEGLLFRLSLRPVRGLDMVRDSGYRDWERWRFLGREIEEVETKDIVLFSLGTCRDIEYARALLAEGSEGGLRLVAGQWREAFRLTYRRHD